ncbi:LacI family DNA-binding transcriptional regulator [Dactylosporangium sp. NPDC050588]|uniref:LacI family DNA-binding transcriptional regulator n=1 Tax=Dactylosporangium sp. NPDC050588 TaxID=3157211 RepID=UPI0033D6B22F
MEVAALSGVSIKTASRALNGESHVARETRERVLRAAGELGVPALVLVDARVRSELRDDLTLAGVHPVIAHGRRLSPT